MEPVNNNQFEIIPNPKTKRKIATTCPNVYLNPALDILANDDPICNNAMEVAPIKKRKRTKSLDITVFENTALDLGVNKAAVSEFLARELNNVRKSIKTLEDKQTHLIPDKRPVALPDVTVIEEPDLEVTECAVEPTYANLNDIRNIENNITDNKVILDDTGIEVVQEDEIEVETDSGISVLEQKSLTLANVAGVFDAGDLSRINHANVTNNIFINNQTNLSLSFIDRLALDSPNISNQSLYLDDDLNESNIMEIKTITIITKKKRIPGKKKNTNPFLNQTTVDVDSVAVTGENPFLNLDVNDVTEEMEYNAEQPCQTQTNHDNTNVLMPRRLFASETNSTISTVNESFSNDSQHEYENIDDYRPESPIYENIGEEMFGDTNYNKQSKILGFDVTKFSAVDIINLNKNSHANNSNESTDSKKDLRHSFLKASNKLSKKVFKTLKKTFKSNKPDQNVTLNPYEVTRKPPKNAVQEKESGIENPCLNLDNSDEIEIEELDDDEEHQYETIKTLRNTRLNMNVTPLREMTNENADSSQNKTSTPGKKVRFDSTLNREKVITGNSFDYGIQSPGFDAKIDKYQDELENCINERKIILQNM